MNSVNNYNKYINMNLVNICAYCVLYTPDKSRRNLSYVKMMWVSSGSLPETESLLLL